MANFSHVNILEGDEKITEQESQKFCIQILGQELKNKIKKNICADIIFIDSKNKKSIGINEARKIKNDVIIKPVECKFKIYIFKNAQNLTEQAQNALLKIFEEPPSHVIFLLLCTNSKNFISTVLSRARIIKLNNYNQEYNNQDIDNFINYLIINNKIYALYICSKYDSDREKLKIFLNNCKNEILLRIKNQILDSNKISFCQKINKVLNYIDMNLNKNLAIINLVLS